MRRRACVLLLGAILTGCGGSETPTAPTPVTTPPPPSTPAPSPPPEPPPQTVANIAGTWTGQIDFLHPTAGARVYPVIVTLQQSANQVTGTWRQPDGPRWRGEIAGTLTGLGLETALDGTTSWDTETSTGTGRCVGHAKIHGQAAPPVITWASEDVHFQTCIGAHTNVRWTLVRTEP